MRTLTVFLFICGCATAQVLWKEPPNYTTADWTWGPGGQKMAPRPPFRFVKEKFGGTNPKIEVRDDADRRWVVKFGSEVHTDTFLARFVSALGYAAEPTYFVPSGGIRAVHGLKRAKYFIATDGSFRNARFKLDVTRSGGDKASQSWSWAENPFIGTRELGGLKVLVMLTSNWDTKDSRNGVGTNTGMIHPVADGDSPAWYAVTDWGATLGRAGSILKFDRWDWTGYRLETSHFVTVGSDGKLRWRFKGKNGRDITAAVGVEDVRWMLQYLYRISDEDLVAGLIASGASEPVSHEYVSLLRERIRQLEGVAQADNVRRAAK